MEGVDGDGNVASVAGGGDAVNDEGEGAMEVVAVDGGDEAVAVAGEGDAAIEIGGRD